MKSLKTALVTSLIGIATFASVASAQWGYDPIMHQSNLLLQQVNQNRANTLAAYQQMMITYYRQGTGDYSTPDAQAAVLGEQLWAQHNPAAYQSVMNRGRQIAARDAQGWANTFQQSAQTNSEIGDMMFDGYMNRSAMQDAGFSNYVQGAIYEEGNFYGSNGAAYSLHVYPDQSMSYSTPDGRPLQFNYASNTWLVGDGFGWWEPLQQY